MVAKGKSLTEPVRLSMHLTFWHEARAKKVD